MYHVLHYGLLFYLFACITYHIFVKYINIMHNIYAAELFNMQHWFSMRWRRRAAADGCQTTGPGRSEHDLHHLAHCEGVDGGLQAVLHLGPAPLAGARQARVQLVVADGGGVGRRRRWASHSHRHSCTRVDLHMHGCAYVYTHTHIWMAGCPLPYVCVYTYMCAFGNINMDNPNRQVAQLQPPEMEIVEDPEGEYVWQIRPSPQ